MSKNKNVKMRGWLHSRNGHAKSDDIFPTHILPIHQMIDTILALLGSTSSYNSICHSISSLILREF